MRPGDVVGDGASRRVSPLFFVLALVCFFFTFAGVSCNTARAKQAVSSLSGLGGGGTTAASVQNLNRCLDALSGANLVTYSGFDFAFGRAPSELSDIPSICQSGAVSPSASSSAPSQATIGTQPLDLLALIAVGLGVIVGAAFLFVQIRARLRLTIAALLSVIGFGLLIFAQVHVHAAIANTLNSAAAGSGAPFSVSDYFVINDGIAWILALVALGAGTFYNVAALLALPAIAQDIPSDWHDPPPQPAGAT
ncbi:MAG: hypothetical protein JOZ92_01915 [Candidatus Dormibacteraeota bacterium]|nr:hypothetical protein [Candidatus Dormibacteraeota bacterium]